MKIGLSSVFFRVSLLLVLSILYSSCNYQDLKEKSKKNLEKEHKSKKEQTEKVIFGAEVLINEKLDILKNQKVAFLGNHTSIVFDKSHLVDTLLALDVNIQKIFTPEHGFRGNKDAGETYKNTKDEKTGLPIISLYGKNFKPKKQDLQEINVLLIDIQDVGARFYTYISTISYAMEACAENDVKVIILDRPNPNAWYVDGPVLNKKYSSFVGMHEVPVVHGMTIGEYALMVNTENWLKNGKKCELQVIEMQGYSHKMRWKETKRKWIAPSPNLGTAYSAYLYPALCFFEGTDVSVGRGTETPFEILGTPYHKGFEEAYQRDTMKQKVLNNIRGLKMENITYIPKSIPGKSKYPKHLNRHCFGVRFLNEVGNDTLFLAGLDLLENFKAEHDKFWKNKAFYNKAFDLLAGSDVLRKAINDRKDPKEIYESWQADINIFKKMRKKYLLYEDFE